MVSNRRPFRFNFVLENRKKSQGAKSGEYGGWGITENFVFHQKLLGEDSSVRRCFVMVKKPGLFFWVRTAV